MALSQALPPTFSLTRLQARARALAPSVVLPLILLAALALRLYGIDWDDGHLFHADERDLLTRVDALELPPASDLGLLLDADESPWNPRWFNYGSLPLYLLKGVQLGLAPVMDLDLFDLRLPGRAISALADVATVLVVYLLALRLGSGQALRLGPGQALRLGSGQAPARADRRVALLAAALTTLAVLHIQLSHFYAVDTLLTLFVLLSLYSLVRVAQGGGQRWWVAAGLSVGLALATKASAAPLLAPLVLAVLLVAWRQVALQEATLPREQRWKSFRIALGNPVRGLALALAAGLLALLVTQPYAFLDWGRFWGDFAEQREMVQRIRDYPFTRQYADTLPYLYQLQQMSLFGLGLPVGVMAWGGLLFAMGRGLLRRPSAELLLLAWVVPYLLIVGAFPVKFLRYLLPVTPLLLLFGAQMLVAALDWARKHRRTLEPWVRVGILLVVASAALYALAYSSIYSRPHPAVRAAEWLDAQGLPRETVVLREHWDDSIPGLGRYQVRELPLYNPDGPGKTKLVADRLTGGDYITLYSSRLYGSIPRLPQRYPQSSRYYELLLREELGYRLVHTETSYPSLPGVAFTNDTFSRPGLPVPQALAAERPAPFTVDLGYADDSFVVFDHPKVLIFQNVERLSQEQLKLLLSGEEEEPRYDLLLMPADEWAAQQGGGTWREIMPPEGLGARLPFPVWLLAVYGVSLAALPLTLTIFRFLPDRGYLLAKPLGLLLVAYTPWLLASLKWVAFSRGSVLVGLALLATLSSWVAVRHREELWGFVRQRWRLLLVGEALFLGAFLAFTLVRMGNPDLWQTWYGGEKPFDMAYLNGVVRSTFMPPYDPWFAGGAINYYYLGYFLVAALIKLTAIPSAIAYNLAVPLFFAMTVGVAFSLGYNLAEGARRALPQERRSRVPPWSPLVAAFGAVLLVAVLGNLNGAVQLVQGAWGSLAHGESFPAFDYWRSSRMMPPDPPGWEITEFPFFSFLFADLHPQMMAIPMALLVLALALNTAVAASNRAHVPAFALTLGALALVVGALWPMNAWDLPTYLAVTVAALAGGEYLRRGRSDLPWLGRWLGLSLGVILLGALFWLPYHLRLEGPLDSLVASPVQTPLRQYLAIHGLLLFLALSLMLALGWVTARRGLAGLGGRLSAATLRPRDWVIGGLALLLLTMLLSLAALGYVTVAFLALLLLPILFLAWRGLAGSSPEAPETPGLPYSLFPLLLVGLALAIGIAVDLVVVGRDIERLNTVFKLYLHGWVLLAVAGSYTLWRLGFVEGLFRGIRLRKGVWLAGLALLVLGAGVFPVLGTRDRLAERFQTLPLTLDGTAFMAEAVYPDANGAIVLAPDQAAIRWLQEQVEGSPVILEAVTPEYRWGGRVSTYTGLPTVLGWRFHEAYRRCGLDPCPAVDTRKDDVARIYSTADPGEALGLLEEYGVTYIFLGENERLYYPGQGLDKFAVMAAAGRLAVAYQAGGVTIYRLPG